VILKIRGDCCDDHSCVVSSWLFHSASRALLLQLHFFQD
jgi:hypothetical protein